MKFFYLSSKNFFLIQIAICLINFTSGKNINEATKELSQNICKNGYSGINCSTPTCVGYNSCMDGSLCEIKNNKIQCVCRIFNSIEGYKEIENCDRTYFILNGICFSNATGNKLCLCKKGWIGQNCERSIVYNESKYMITNHVKKEQFKARKSIFPCHFTDFEGKIFKGNCIVKRKIDHGVCYLVEGEEEFHCECDIGWNSDKSCTNYNCHYLDDCSGHGGCIIENSDQIVCICTGSFYGPKCEFNCYITCNNGKLVYTGTACYCECVPPYLPPECLYTTPKPTNYIPTGMFSTPSNTALNNEQKSDSNKSLIGIILGCIVAAIFIIAAAVTTIIIIKRKRAMKFFINTTRPKQKL